MEKFSLGLRPSPIKESDYLIAPLLLDMEDDGKDIDFTNEQSPVKSQGHKGACVGFSGVAVKEWQEFKETGKHLDLSEQWLYEKARERGGFKEGIFVCSCFRCSNILNSAHFNWV